MSYTRVIPRDFFNESKLLKCLGQLSLLIHEGKGIRWPLRFEDNGEPFEIELDEANCGLFCANYRLYCRETPVDLRTIYNSKESYPLVFTIDEVEDYVFTVEGRLSPEFMAALDAVVVS